MSLSVRSGWEPCACASSPLPPAWPAAESSPLERLEALEAEELRLLAVGLCGRLLPEVAECLRRIRLKRVELPLCSGYARTARAYELERRDPPAGPYPSTNTVLRPESSSS